MQSGVKELLEAVAFRRDLTAIWALLRSGVALKESVGGSTCNLKKCLVLCVRAPVIILGN